MRVCPECGSSELIKHDPVAVVQCSECGWVQAVSQTKVSFQANLPFYKWSIMGLAVLFFVMMTIQFMTWRDFSYDVAHLTVKRVLGTETLDDWIELGTICNSLQKSECALHAFQEVLKHEPNHMTALANLGINFAKLKRYSEAKSYFRVYFSLGGQGYDVMLWFARTVFDQEQPEEGLRWYYEAVKSNLKYDLATEELIEKLRLLKRYEEALGVIGAVTRGRIDTEKWSNLVFLVVKEMRAEPISQEVSFHIPSLDGEHFFVPVWLTQNSRMNFFTVNTNVKGMTLGEDFLSENLISIPKELKSVKIKTTEGEQQGYAFDFKQVQVGRVKIPNLEVKVCEACTAQLGDVLRRHFRLQYWNSHRTEFLTLTQSSSLLKDESQ